MRDRRAASAPGRDLGGPGARRLLFAGEALDEPVGGGDGRLHDDPQSGLWDLLVAPDALIQLDGVHDHRPRVTELLAQECGTDRDRRPELDTGTARRRGPKPAVRRDLRV